MRIELELRPIERHELRDSTPGSGQKLEERAVAETVVGRRVEALEETLDLLLVEVAGVRAWVGRLGELDPLWRRDRQIQENAELEKAA
jgi:hypothetical protein